MRMSQDKFRIFDPSRISAFIKYIVYWGFLVHRPRYWSIFTCKSHLKNEGPEPLNRYGIVNVQFKVHILVVKYTFEIAMFSAVS